MPKVSFTTTLQQFGKTATGIEVPEDKVLALGAGKRVAITVAIGRYSYRTSVAPYRGMYLIPVAAEHREGAGIQAGERITVTMTPDTASRAIEMPADLAKALRGKKQALAFWKELSPSNQKAFATWIESAKKPETREARVATSAQALIDGRSSYRG